MALWDPGQCRGRTPEQEKGCQLAASTWPAMQPLPVIAQRRKGQIPPKHPQTEQPMSCAHPATLYPLGR